MNAKIGCQTLPWTEFTFEEALSGIRAAGYEYVCTGTQHQGVPIFPDDISDEGAEAVGAVIAETGLNFEMIMASTGNLDSDESIAAYERKLEIAVLLDVPFVVSWGPWEYLNWPDEKYPADQWNEITDVWFAGMDRVAEFAAGSGVTIVLKPHTGTTAFGARAKATVERIGSDSVRICYDAGNVSFYEGLDTAEDIKDCAEYVAAMCIKDHRGARANPVFPPVGEGDIDHSAIMTILAAHDFSGPLMVERFEGSNAKKEMSLELVNERARAARIYLEKIVSQAG